MSKHTSSKVSDMMKGLKSHAPYNSVKKEKLSDSDSDPAKDSSDEEESKKIVLKPLDQPSHKLNTSETNATSNTLEEVRASKNG